MRIYIGDGRLAAIKFDGCTRMNVNGISYNTNTQLEFWEDGSDDSILLTFDSRDQLLKFARKIVSEIEGQMESEL